MLILLLAGCALALYMAYRVAFWIAEGNRVLSPGHVAPRPSLTSRFLRLVLGRLLLFLFVGPVRVIGARNFDFFGRFIALGNHQTERDALVTLWLMGARPLRYFIANNQASGFRAPIVAYTGGIVVHPEPTAAAASLLAAIRVLKKEQDCSFVLFPQGRLIPNNKLLRQDFHPGVVMLGKKTSKNSEDPVAYLPFGIFYDRNPAHADAFHRVVNRWMGIKNFRKFFGDITYGAVIVVGAPIPVEILPADTQKATDILFEQVCTLAQRAELIAKD
jgi:1-acyl-sn-glycerol-3-phosphate acyltransferase